MLSDSQIPAPRVPITGAEGGIITREWFRFFNYVYETLLRLTSFAYGVAYGTTNTAWAADTPSLVPLDVVDITSGLSVAASRVTVQTAGLYTVTANVQLTNANVSNGDSLSVWLRVNSVDVPATTNTAFVPAQVGAVAGQGLLTLSFTRQFISGDYFELYGLSKLGYAQIATTPASLSPAYPAAPGTTLTVAQIR
jgi:hypothetical protein